MKRDLKVILFSILFILSLIILLVFFKNGFTNYVIISGVVCVILFIILVSSLFSPKDEEAIYKQELNKILKNYDAILAKSSVLPELDDRNIIILETMQDLVNAQGEIRKPIFYKMQVSCCIFVLLDEKDACVYTLKLNDKIVSDLDLLIEEKKLKRKNKIDDYSILKDIDKTSIIVLENAKSYKVTPIRKKEDDHDSLEEIEIL